MPSNDEIRKFKERAYVRKDEDGNEIMGVRGNSPQLTISRLRRCQNCLHFDIEEKAKSYFYHCLERDKVALKISGCSAAGIKEHVQKLNRGIRDNLGAVGLCTIRDKRTDSGADGDFTPFMYQCDKWNGRIVLSAAEAAQDPSHQEVFDNVKKVDR